MAVNRLSQRKFDVDFARIKIVRVSGDGSQMTEKKWQEMN
jgi:hypothetical protein